MKRRLIVITTIGVLALFVTLLLVRTLNYSVITNANSIAKGMSTNDVLKIMGTPRNISVGPQALENEEWRFTEWDYDGPGRWNLMFSLRPLRFSAWERN